VPVVLQVYPNNTVATVGENVLLTCVAYGFPEPVVEWRREDEGELPPLINISSFTWMADGITFVASTLQICDLQLSDSGLYSCTAAGGEMRNFTIEIQCKHCFVSILSESFHSLKLYFSSLLKYNVSVYAK